MRVPRIVNWISDWFRCPRFEDSGGPWNQFHAEVMGYVTYIDERRRDNDAMEFVRRSIEETRGSHASTLEAIQKTLADVARFSMLGLGLIAAIARFTEDARFLAFPIGCFALSTIAAVMGLNVARSGSNEISKIQDSDIVRRTASVLVVNDLYNTRRSLHTIQWGSRVLRRSIIFFVCGILSFAFLMVMQADRC